MGIYTSLKSLNAETTFKYMCIIIAMISLFKTKTVGLNVVVGLAFAVLIVSYIHEKDVQSNQLKDTEKETKVKAIKPEPKNFKDKDDIINFFFSVQDLYQYNPQAYEECVDNVRAFFKLYNTVFIGTEFCDDYFIIAKSKKNNALNCFHSLIFKLPQHAVITDKFNRAHKRLETLLTKYLNELFDKCDQNLITNGYSINKRSINLGPTEYNVYSDIDKTYSFQIY